MLERIREGSQGPLAMTIVGLIIISFAVTGVGSYLGSSSPEAAATVNGEEITVNELDIAYENQRNRIEQQFGESVTAAFANESYLATFRAEVLQQLISEKLIQQQANDIGLRVSDEQIKQAIFEIDAFKIAGQFDNETFKAILARQRLTPATFRESMRKQMTAEQLANALNGSSFSLEDEVLDILRLQQQTRTAKTLQINSDIFGSEVSVSDDEISQYYQGNLSQFDTLEQVKLSYVSISVDDLMVNETVTAEEVRTNYEQNIAAYQTLEQRRVSHILIEFGDDQEAAKAEAEEVLALVNAEGADFAAIASERSADTISAEIGGDLDFIARGDWSESFEDAAFGLSAVGEISELVSTEFGYHIIQLTELNPVRTTPFADVEEELTTTLLKDKALENFYALQEQMASAAFESPFSLEEVANVVNRPIIDTAFFEKNNYPASVDYPQVANIAFDAELIEFGRNSDVLQVSDEKMMVVRVSEHKPQRTLPLEEVKPQIKSRLENDKKQQAGIDWAEGIKAALLNGESVEEELAAKSLQWNVVDSLARFSDTPAAEITTAIFELSPLEQQNTAVVKLNSGNVAIVVLESVQAALEIEEADLAAGKTGLARNEGRKTYDNFVQALMAAADIEIPTRN